MQASVPRQSRVVDALRWTRCKYMQLGWGRGADAVLSSAVLTNCMQMGTGLWCKATLWAQVVVLETEEHLCLSHISHCSSRPEGKYWSIFLLPCSIDLRTGGSIWLFQASQERNGERQINETLRIEHTVARANCKVTLSLILIHNTQENFLCHWWLFQIRMIWLVEFLHSCLGNRLLSLPTLLRDSKSLCL